MTSEATIQTAVELAALRRLDLIAPTDVVRWAVEHLVEEPTPPALVELASLPEPVEAPEVDTLLDRLLDDEGQTRPDRRETGLLIARVLARRIVDGSVEAASGARSIWWDVVANIPELRPELAVFVGLASEWEDSPDFRADYERDIVAAAARLLAAPSPTPGA